MTSSAVAPDHGGGRTALPEPISGPDRLPRFDPGDYQRLLSALRGAGYALRSVGEMRNELERPAARSAYIRHDVDFHVQLLEPLAELEHREGVRATYYLLLTQHYNLWQRDNLAALRRLVDLGHEIGLHYDLATYPAEGPAARARLEQEVAILETLAGVPVTTIVMHQPSLGGTDVFREIDEYVHPHDPRLGDGLVYVSDSCRGWRDTTLLDCWTETPPDRLLLNTHAELWLDSDIDDPHEYLDFLIEASSRPYRDFIDKEVRASWTARIGPRRP